MPVSPQKHRGWKLCGGTFARVLSSLWQSCEGPRPCDSEADHGDVISDKTGERERDCTVHNQLVRWQICHSLVWHKWMAAGAFTTPHPPLSLLWKWILKCSIDSFWLVVHPIWTIRISFSAPLLHHQGAADSSSMQRCVWQIASEVTCVSCKATRGRDWVYNQPSTTHSPHPWIWWCIICYTWQGAASEVKL